MPPKGGICALFFVRGDTSSRILFFFCVDPNEKTGKKKREEINNVARLYKRETARFEHAAGPRDDKKKGVVVAVAVVVVSFLSRARASRRRRRLAFLRCVLSRLQKGRTIN
tara:strand:+ start:10338 stop:10670 length:333 start_codon:yes stop_codon:yes gene_type:complete